MPVFRLHYGFVLVHWIGREVVEVSVMVEDAFGQPLYPEVIIVLNGRLLGTDEELRLVVFVRQGLHFGVPLETTAFCHAEDQINSLALSKSLA